MAAQIVRVYGSAPGIAWARDGQWVILVDWEGDRTWVLAGLEAAMWDLVAGGYSFERLVHFMTALAGVSREEAQTLVLTTIDRWQHMGILCLAGEAGCDQPGHQRRL